MAKIYRSVDATRTAGSSSRSLRSKRSSPHPCCLVMIGAPQSALHLAAPAIANPRARSPRRRKTPQPAPDIQSPYIAIAKIRKMTDPVWRPWDGWLPTSTVVVTKTADEEVLRQCIPDLGNPLRLGKTLADEPFHIEQAALGALNLIAGIEGSGTAHLAQVLDEPTYRAWVSHVLSSTPKVSMPGFPKNAYVPPPARGYASRSSLSLLGKASSWPWPHVSPDTFSTMLRHFGLPTAVALYFTSHVARRFARLKSQHDTDQPPAFLGIDDLIHLARDLETEGQSVAGGAILSCLDAIKQAQIFATQPSECTAWHDGYAEIRHGGALVIDLSKLTRCARTSVVCIACRQPERHLRRRKGRGIGPVGRACFSTRPSCLWDVTSSLMSSSR